MNSHKVNATQEKSRTVPILNNLLPIINNNNLSPTVKKEYSLQHSFFDPCKNSPPNEFMLKLEKRLKNYDLGIN